MKMRKVFWDPIFKVESENECIIHFTGLLTEEERKLDNAEEIARNKAKPYGGYKYIKKNYPCAIAFDLPEKEGRELVKKMINELSELD
jgi:hypothetical protein